MNLAPRLAKLSAKLGGMIVASTEFATEAPQQLCAVEELSVASLAAGQTAFGLAEETVSLKNN